MESKDKFCVHYLENSEVKEKEFEANDIDIEDGFIWFLSDDKIIASFRKKFVIFVERK